VAARRLLNGSQVSTFRSQFDAWHAGESVVLRHSLPSTRIAERAGHVDLGVGLVSSCGISDLNDSPVELVQATISPIHEYLWSTMDRTTYQRPVDGWPVFEFGATRIAHRDASE